MNLRAGLIGLGMMGRHHARILSNLADVEFVGSCDLDASNIIHSQGKPVYREISELLNQGLDYAVIAVPTKYHVQVALELVRLKIHALIEKPLSDDFGTSKAIADAFSINGLVGGVGHIERFNPAVREARKRLDLLGDLYQVSTRRQGPFPGRISDVGVIKDLATHDIDITTWVSGQEFTSISARTAHKSGRVNEDMLVAVGTLDNGAISNHVVNWLSPKKERLVVLIGENGAFEIDTLNADLTFFKNGLTKNNWEELARFRGVSEGDIIRFAIEKKEPLLIEHENFRDAVLGKPSETVTLDDGAKIVMVAEKMLESAQQGMSVEVKRL